MSSSAEQAHDPAWPYGGDEICADGIIHGLGLLLAAGGTIVLLGFLFPESDLAYLLAHVVYCGTLLATLTISAVYNMWPVSPTKWVLRRVDHAMIFGLIAGTYTPFLLRIGSLETTVLLALIWIASAVGMALKLLDIARHEVLSTVLYSVIGWSGLVAIRSLWDSLPLPSLMLVLIGGLLYSVGVIFHHWRGLRFQNAIWHGFVLAASSCHFVAVLTAVDAH